MQAEPHFSWLREFVVPVLFTLLGGALGFVTSQLRDELKERRAKKSFLRAIGMELDTLSVQLSNSLETVKESIKKISDGANTGPALAAAWRTSVFTAQVGNLRDLADPLLIEVLHFYSDLASLDQVVEKVNVLGAEFDHANVVSGAKDSLRPRLLSRLRGLGVKVSDLDERIRNLRTKLPHAM
jgi:hypothetical protein